MARRNLSWLAESPFRGSTEKASDGDKQDKKDKDERMSGPAEVKSTDEIVKSAEKDYKRNLAGKPQISIAEYRSDDFKAFVAWYCPYSGVNSCHVYLYLHFPQLC